MTEKRYLIEIGKILRLYHGIAKNWSQSSGEMQLCILRERNEKIEKLAKFYYLNRRLK